MALDVHKLVTNVFCLQFGPGQEGFFFFPVCFFSENRLLLLMEMRLMRV